MANELVGEYLTGSTAKTLLWNAAGQVWNGSAFVAWSAADIATYGITTTEAVGSARYFANFPAAVTTVGTYTYSMYVQNGGAFATTDLPYRFSAGSVDWIGTAVQNPATLLDGVTVEGGITPGATLTNDSGTQLSSINARQALALASSTLGGVLSGAGTTTETFKGAGLPAGNSRVVATVTAVGARTAITLKVPD